MWAEMCGKSDRDGADLGRWRWDRGRGPGESGHDG